MNELALFAGAGGGMLGSHMLGWRTVAAVEKDIYCTAVLLQRQADGLLPKFPIWDDVRTFDGKQWQRKIDVITAGFPCQPFSLSGKQKGEQDDRNMWPDTIRIIREVKPSWCLLENVPGLLTNRYFGRILSDLAEGGYNAKWGVLSAIGCGAPHIRKRLWIVANANCKGLIREKEIQSRLQIFTCLCKWWSTEPDVGRVANGVANRVDRLKALGNGQVPAVVRKAWGFLSKDSNQ